MLFKFKITSHTKSVGENVRFLSKTSNTHDDEEFLSKVPLYIFLEIKLPKVFCKDVVASS